FPAFTVSEMLSVPAAPRLTLSTNTPISHPHTRFADMSRLLRRSVRQRSESKAWPAPPQRPATRGPGCYSKTQPLTSSRQRAVDSYRAVMIHHSRLIELNKGVCWLCTC